MVSKKNKNTKSHQSDGSAPPPLPQKDLYHRINFAVQASAFLQSLDVGSSIVSPITGCSTSSTSTIHQQQYDRKGKRGAAENGGPVTRKVVEFGQLARDEMRMTKKMAVHTQLKLDPSLKRSICQSCGTLLIPGLTSRLRSRANRNHLHVVHHTCLQCSTRHTIPSPPTSMSDETDLDGPVRRRRREKVIRRTKVVYHEREAMEGVQGHRMWQDEAILRGWGVCGHTQEEGTES